MSNKRRYAVDPTVQGVQPTIDSHSGYNQQQQQPYYTQSETQAQGQGQGQVYQAPVDEYQNAYSAPGQKKGRVWDDDLLPPPPPFVPGESNGQLGVNSEAGLASGEMINRSATHSPLPPVNHIPQPPHAAGPSIRGPKPRIDPTQVPSPIEVAELDQNLSDLEDFQSCRSRGIIPLATTDYRGVDQGEYQLNSRPWSARLIRNRF
jgi:protein transport protein SEC24